MKRFSFLALAMSVLTLGCKGSSSPAEPTGTTTTTTNYTINLSPANERPPITNADAGITGVGTIALTVTKEGSTVRSATADFRITGSGFPAGATVNMAHIHAGGSDVNGGIVVNTGITPSDVPITAGACQVTKSSVSVPADVAQAILANPGNYYFNVHTLLNPDGAVRGQLAAGGSGGSVGGVPYPDPY